ncbi:MAG: VOC family protein [Sandaracinaceae bacterium]
MIRAAHTILYSKDAEADRAFFRDVLGFSHVDVGGGWLIFALPPSEVAMHPSDTGGKHELYLVCDSITAFVASMKERGVPCTAVHEERWGSLVRVTLPSGAELGVYEPKHALAHG